MSALEDTQLYGFFASHTHGITGDATSQQAVVITSSDHQVTSNNASQTHGITGDANLPAVANNTICSSAVTHPSTNMAQRCLTSVFEWELVRSARHDIVDLSVHR